MFEKDLLIGLKRALCSLFGYSLFNVICFMLYSKLIIITLFRFVQHQIKYIQHVHMQKLFVLKIILKLFYSIHPA